MYVGLILHSVHFEIFDRDISLDIGLSRILTPIYIRYLAVPRTKGSLCWTAATLYLGLSPGSPQGSVDEPDWLTPRRPKLGMAAAVITL